MSAGALFSAVAGLTYGAWIDGTSPLVLAVWLAVFITALAALLSVASHPRPSALKGA
jgi:hypothetical protein